MTIIMELFKKKTIEVHTTTISDYCKNNRIDLISLLKLDIQGADKFALEGTKKCLPLEV
ncbi:MAG: FkbM family methyltransferase [Thermosynechococcaceae cyanobacterium MS004]|nr:FkbM family methyltransferase [Thermosynechococcaceae cyanobacterium MS004]